MTFSSIIGLGTDIIEINRIQKAFQRHGQRFLNRIYLPNEQRYCLEAANPLPRLAARFAAKEAVVKSLGSGFGPCSWLDIEVAKDPTGRPIVLFSKNLSTLYGPISFLLSISHSLHYATATAICFKTN